MSGAAVLAVHAEVAHPQELETVAGFCVPEGRLQLRALYDHQGFRIDKILVVLVIRDIIRVLYGEQLVIEPYLCLLYTSPSPRD